MDPFNRVTNKPYFGVGDVTIISSEDFRVPSLTKNGYDRIRLSWYSNNDGYMVFNLTINGYPFITESTLIPRYSSNEELIDLWCTVDRWNILSPNII